MLYEVAPTWLHETPKCTTLCVPQSWRLEESQESQKDKQNALKPKTINYPAEHLTRQSISPPRSAWSQFLSSTISNNCDGLYPLDPLNIFCPSTWITASDQGESTTKHQQGLSQEMAYIQFWLSLLLAPLPDSKFGFKAVGLRTGFEFQLHLSPGLRLWASCFTFLSLGSLLIHWGSECNYLSEFRGKFSEMIYVRN